MDQLIMPGVHLARIPLNVLMNTKLFVVRYLLLSVIKRNVGVVFDVYSIYGT